MDVRQRKKGAKENEGVGSNKIKRRTKEERLELSDRTMILEVSDRASIYLIIWRMTDQRNSYSSNFI